MTLWLDRELTVKELLNSLHIYHRVNVSIIIDLSNEEYVVISKPCRRIEGADLLEGELKKEVRSFENEYGQGVAGREVECFKIESLSNGKMTISIWC